MTPYLPSSQGSDFQTFVSTPHEDQRRALAELFATQMACYPIERVHVAFDSQRPAEGHFASTRVPRLSLPLSGRHPFELNRGDGAETVRLVPGEALFMLPGAWRRALFDEERTHTAVVFEDTYIWFFAQHCGPTRPEQPQLCFHTATPVVPEGLDLLHALMAIARSGRNTTETVPLVRSLLRITLRQLDDSPAVHGDAGEALWKSMCAYIRDRYALPLDRESLATAFEVHPNHVSRLFKRHGNEGYNRFLVRTRLEKATALLQHTALTIEDIALQCGFNDDNYFRFAFRRFFGASPGRFRQQNHLRAFTGQNSERIAIDEAL
ncbi:MAG TPA: AraC family transcriptional regulator [Opitutaceae bacterium]|nr:AraC family transcriptional regulator [Opitutaceae bacterium]